MKRLIQLLLAIAFAWFIVSVTFGAEPAAKPAAINSAITADVQPVPNVKQLAPAGETLGRRQKDEGLEKILDKKYRVPTPDPFAGFRILMWGVSIAGVLLGLFVAAVIVVFTLRFLRKTAMPAAGVPDASFAALQVFDNITQRIENRRKELEAEQAEIDKRMGKTKRTSKPKTPKAK